MNTNKTAKRILCYGDSNTRWRVPGSMGMQRYPVDERWPGILQEMLGQEYEVIEEWLWARTTMFDDPRPEFPERNGLKTLPIILETHLPVDLVIVMLGTTDTKEMMNITSEQSTKGMSKIIETIKTYKVLTWYHPPEILVIVPPIVDESWNMASQLFRGWTQKWNELIQSYKTLTQNENVLYLDPTTKISVDKKEGVHLDSKSHQKLAELIYETIQK